MKDYLVQKAFSITHASEISAARRHCQQAAALLGFDETESGKAAIIVTEAATNMLKHAGDGLILLTAVRRDKMNGIEVLALDHGPGIANLDQSLRDGTSTTGTAGTGLGAMRRLAHEFDAYSAPGKGTALFLCIWSGLAPDNISGARAILPDVGGHLRCGTVCLPVAGEEECGDAWGIVNSAGEATILVVDGLGHGPNAAQASHAAVQVLHSRSGLRPAPLIEAMHQALRTTRGAAAAVAKLDSSTETVSFAGIGNISASILDGDARKQLVSHNGIVGHNLRKVQEFATPWPAGATCILCSDGIGTQWDLNNYPGLRHCHPALIAGVLYRDFARSRDDATVVVAKRLS
ncbi:MAG: serine/threonine protein kinase [Burkholderiales bacterium RIFCSPLOWO2_02_FULL_57_36]|nr:MAG: serine/threonine protein kinase [Burkholderiales bacterium RIFCSPLOWO2_02_FULL_57_36]